MSDKDCGSCNDQQHINDILNSLPQSVHRPQGYGLASIRHTIYDDGKERMYSFPKIHDDGTVEYDRKGTEPEPPPDIRGYRRDADNPFLFHPAWPDCSFRMQGARIDQNTGALQLVMVCNHPEAEHFGKYVSAVNCDECPVRKAMQ